MLAPVQSCGLAASTCDVARRRRRACSAWPADCRNPSCAPGPCALRTDQGPWRYCVAAAAVRDCRSGAPGAAPFTTRIVDRRGLVVVHQRQCGAYRGCRAAAALAGPGRCRGRSNRGGLAQPGHCGGHDAGDELFRNGADAASGIRARTGPSSPARTGVANSPTSSVRAAQMSGRSSCIGARRSNIRAPWSSPASKTAAQSSSRAARVLKDSTS